MYDEYKIKPLHIRLQKTSAYVKSHDGQSKGMYLLIEDVDLSEKCNTLWDKVSSDIKKINSELVYDKKYLKTKIKPYSDEATDFYDKEIT